MSIQHTPCVLLLLLLGHHVHSTVHTFNQDIYVDEEAPSSLCPGVTACSCFDSGTEVRAECFGEFLDHIPARKYMFYLMFYVTVCLPQPQW